MEIKRKTSYCYNWKCPNCDRINITYIANPCRCQYCSFKPETKWIHKNTNFFEIYNRIHGR